MSENYWVAIHLLLQLYRLTVCVRHLQANDVLYNQLENVLIHKNILMEKIYWIEMIFFLYSIKMSSKYFFILNYFYISIYDIFPHRGLPYIPITWAFLDLKKNYLGILIREQNLYDVLLKVLMQPFQFLSNSFFISKFNKVSYSHSGIYTNSSHEELRSYLPLRNAIFHCISRDPPRDIK